MGGGWKGGMQCWLRGVDMSPQALGYSGQGHRGARQIFEAYRMMAAAGFSLEGEGGTEFSPSSFLSVPSSS